jgi:DNA repair exonuclease SbcCD ATPase subunit
MWRLRRKTERGWNDGFHINTKAEAEGLCELLNKLEHELTEALSDLEFRRDLFKLQEQQLNNVRKERDELLAYADKLAAGLPEGMLPKDVEVLREANLGLSLERDRLAEALERILSYQGRFAEEDPESIAAEALAAVKGGSYE